MDIEVKGDIVNDDDKWIYDWFGISAVSPKDVTNALNSANGQAITVKVNSGGGSVFAASEIYTSLKNYKGDVNIEIQGLAASAASVISMAGKSKMSPTAQMMIHNVSTGTQGDYRDMQHSAEILKNANKTVASAYILKSGLSEEEVLNMMNEETWLTAQQAKDLGLIDEIMFNNSLINFGNIDLKAMYNSLPSIPNEIIQKMKENNKDSQPIENEVDFLNLEKKILQNEINKKRWNL